jgi:hypothetical protein
MSSPHPNTSPPASKAAAETPTDAFSADLPPFPDPGVLDAALYDYFRRSE